MMKDDSKTKKRKRIEGDDDESPFAHDKRARACAIVTGYITRIAKKEDMKTLGLSGVVNIPASIVDSSGLLGMTLAFCAAAGEIPMPENGDDDSKLRPWDEIDVDGCKTSAERSKNLEKQLDLLQKKIEQVKESTRKRNLLSEETISKREEAEATIFENEKEAKRMIMRNKTKKTPSKPDQKGGAESVLVVSADISDAAEATLEVEADAHDSADVVVSADVDDDDDPTATEVEEVKAEIEDSDDDISEGIVNGEEDEGEDNDDAEEETAMEVEAVVDDSEDSDEDLLA
jgi:TolA-binding protein